jgi:cellulose synthase/poly-beta-1,6-N-acetylglucosamine synthase-like glycosyltransferase
MERNTGAAQVSVVIPIYNADVGSLMSNLSALVRNEDNIIKEIVLVDDGSKNTLTLVAGQLAAITPKIALIEQDKQGEGAGRNAGVRRATADVIAFTDSDCLPKEEWLHNLTSPIIEGLACATGGTVKSQQPISSTEQFSDFMKALRQPIRDSQGRIVILMTANAAFARTVFEEVGGFDQRFRRAAGEDLDLTYRLSSAGYADRLMYVPSAVVEHRHRSGFLAFLKQQSSYGFWDMYHFLLRKRDPEVLGVSFPTVGNVLRQIMVDVIASLRLCWSVPIQYGLTKKFIVFPSIYFARKLAVLWGGIRCYYFAKERCSSQ